jgi:hypothetical protein
MAAVRAEEKRLSKLSPEERRKEIMEEGIRDLRKFREEAEQARSRLPDSPERF